MAAEHRQPLDPVHDRCDQHRHDRGEHEDEPDVGQLQYKRGGLAVELDDCEHDQQIDKDSEWAREHRDVSLAGCCGGSGRHQ